MNKLKRIIAALLITVAAATMAACHTLTQGEVYDKEYIPAHTEYYTDTDYVYRDGKRHYYTTVKSRYCPDEYRIYIRKETEKGEFEKDCYTVGKERYESIKIGDEVSFE